MGPILEPTGRDGELWAWWLRAPNQSAVVRVFVSGSAVALREHSQHEATREAVLPSGRSAVEPYLGEEDPPGLIEFTTTAGPIVTRRSAIEVEAPAQPDTVTGTAAQILPPLTQSAKGAVSERHLSTDVICFELHWHSLSDQPGMWMVQVFDSQGALLDSGVGDDAQDAILGVAERLLPRENDSSG
jgi:hypothetical protein